MLCHNDLLPANLIAGEDRLWLIDWEYAGMGHPLFDLASLSANAGFTAGEDAGLLAAYRGEVDPRTSMSSACSRQPPPSARDSGP